MEKKKKKNTMESHNFSVDKSRNKALSMLSRSTLSNSVVTAMWGYCAVEMWLAQIEMRCKCNIHQIPKT